MQLSADLPFLVKLLEDDDPSVQAILAKTFARSSGDLSRELEALAIQPTVLQRRRLSLLLGPGRRRALRAEWFVPERGLPADEEGWETFEMLLRLVSDLLHDGVTARPNFVEALDQLADEVTLCAADEDEESLSAHLFGSGRFRANSRGYYDPENSDLLWILTHRLGNPIGLTILAMLVARRLGHTILGCNLPGHFLGWIGHGPQSRLVDCYHRGKLIDLAELLRGPAPLSEEARAALRGPCSLQDILQRVLANLHFALDQDHRTADAALVSELLQSILTA